MPSHLPLPATFVRQRPDIRQAEANVHALSAQIGVAIAARLPNVTLSANAGFSGFSYAPLFTPLFSTPLSQGTSFWLGGSNIAAPVFDGFTLINKQKAAEVALTQAEAQYRQAVITAFQNVADALHALREDDKAVKAAVHGERAAKDSFEIVKNQFFTKEGSFVNILQLLQAEQTWLQASVTRMSAEGQRLTDVVGLFMALGGGWSDRNLRDLPPSGPNGPTAEQIARINGPVNPSWFPSAFQSESADNRAQRPNPPAPPVGAPFAPVALPAPAPIDALKPPPGPPSGWLPNFLERAEPVLGVRAASSRGVAAPSTAQLRAATYPAAAAGLLRYPNDRFGSRRALPSP